MCSHYIVMEIHFKIRGLYSQAIQARKKIADMKIPKNNPYTQPNINNAIFRPESKNQVNVRTLDYVLPLLFYKIL